MFLITLYFDQRKKHIDQCEKSSEKCSDIITETLVNLKNHQRNVQTLSLKTGKSLERVKQWFVPSFTTLRITDFRDTHTPGKTIINHHLVALCQTISRSYIPCHFVPNCQTVRLSDKKQTFNIPSLGRVESDCQTKNKHLIYHHLVKSDCQTKKNI